MLIKSFSKINLSLSVINKLKKKGLHEIQSYYCLINLYDQIKLKKINGPKDIIKFTGEFSKSVDSKNNSVLESLDILRSKKLISDNYKIEINKKIPVFSGMGGGTSNAYFVANHLLKKGVNGQLKKIFMKRIGSDFVLFSSSQGFLSDLNTIKKFNKNYNLHFLLIYPNIQCSTKFVYSKVKKFSKKCKYDFNTISSKRKFKNLILNIKNDLQPIVEKNYPILKRLINQIRNNKGCYFSRMTGSGSICYGVFNSDKSAKGALRKLKQKYPKFWMTIAKTI